MNNIYKLKCKGVIYHGILSLLGTFYLLFVLKVVIVLQIKRFYSNTVI